MISVRNIMLVGVGTRPTYLKFMGNTVQQFVKHHRMTQTPFSLHRKKSDRNILPSDDSRSLLSNRNRSTPAEKHELEIHDAINRHVPPYQAGFFGRRPPEAYEVYVDVNPVECMRTSTLIQAHAS